MPGAVRALLAVLLLASAGRADEPPAEARMPFVAGGVVRTVFRPEFRDAPWLLEEMKRVPVEGLRVDAIGPIVPRPAPAPDKPAPPPAPTRLLLQGPPESVSRGREALRFLDTPRPAVVVSLLVAETHAIDRAESGGHVLFDRDRDPVSNGLFRGAAATFEPDDYLRATLTGARPFEGTSIRLAEPESGYERVLRMLLARHEAEFLAWPTILCTEDEPGTIAATETVPQVAFGRAGPVVARQAIGTEEAGIRLSVRPVRVGDDGATLDVTAWIRVAPPAQTPDAVPGSRELRTRQVQTRVSVRDRDAVLLGGLRLRRALHARRGMPGLQDLCFVGPLYGARTGETEDTEIVLLLRTRIVTPGPRSGRVPCDVVSGTVGAAR